MSREETPTLMQRKVKAAALAIADLMEMPSNKDSAEATLPLAKELIYRLEAMASVPKLMRLIRYGPTKEIDRDP